MLREVDSHMELYRYKRSGSSLILQPFKQETSVWKSVQLIRILEEVFKYQGKLSSNVFQKDV